MHVDRPEKRAGQVSADAETRGLAQDAFQAGWQLLESGLGGAAAGYVGGKVAAAASKPDTPPPPQKKDN
jgi:hypothetical protein